MTGAASGGRGAESQGIVVMRAPHAPRDPLAPSTRETGSAPVYPAAPALAAAHRCPPGVPPSPPPVQSCLPPDLPQ